MPNTRTPSESPRANALSGREARRVAQLIVQGASERRAVPAPSGVLGSLSLADARRVRDRVVLADVSTGDAVEVICAHANGEPVLLTSTRVTNGRARVQAGADRLSVSALAGVRAERDEAGMPRLDSRGVTPVVGLLLMREPFAAGTEAPEDSVAANGGAILATVALNGTAESPELGSEGGAVTVDPVPSIADLVAAAGDLLASAHEGSRILSDRAGGAGATGTFITLLGTPISAPLPVEAGQTVHLSAQDIRLLEVKVDLGDLSDWSKLA